jgi:hypothetical protein
MRFWPWLSSLNPCQRDSSQDQGDASEGDRGDGLVEDQDAEHDGDDGQQVGHGRCGGCSVAGARNCSIPA